MESFWQKLNEECEKQAKIEVESLPSLSVDEAVAIQTELLAKYGDPAFQLQLYSIYAREDPRSSTYTEKMSALFRAARSEVLPKYNIAADEDGATKVAIALGDFHGHPEVDMLAGRIDDALYSAEEPMIMGSTTLTKQQVLSICRAQIAAFKKPAFQEKIRQQMKANPYSGMDFKAFRTHACSKVAIEEQVPILLEFGLEPSERGAHSLFHQVAQYMMDPEVAACVAAINTLLGMDKSAIQKFAEKAIEISQHDPCPRMAKVEEPPAPPAEPVPEPKVEFIEVFKPMLQGRCQPSRPRAATVL